MIVITFGPIRKGCTDLHEEDGIMSFICELHRARGTPLALHGNGATEDNELRKHFQRHAPQSRVFVQTRLHILII